MDDAGAYMREIVVVVALPFGLLVRCVMAQRSLEIEISEDVV